MTEPDIDASIASGLSEAATGPGHRLRQARERKGLNIGEVSDLLHLPERLVSAIENDDFTELPGAVFAQGYLRNYARLVGEPADDIVKMFNNVRPREEYKPALRQFQLPMKSNQVNSSHGLVKAVTWLIVIALLILLFVWWRGYIKLPVPMLGEAEIGVTTPGSSPDSPPPSTSASPGESTVLQIPALTTMPAEAPGDAGATAAVPGVPDEPVNDEVVMEETAGDTAAQEMEETDRPATIGSSPVAEEGEVQAATGDSPPADEIKLVFQAPCWVDIRDAEGEKVLYGGIGAGETFSLAGTPPYQVVLGNSHAVMITIGGKVYSTDAHSRGRVAKFVLDPAKALTAANGSEQ